tara:strand:- start:821 stop:1072 length:252 start_codon:yes stop_codon:yes gene_type:complete
MEMTNILHQEFIGLHVKEEGKKVEGKIIDETKNSFLVKTKDGRKRLLKANSLFKMKSNNKIVEVPGNLILMRPEDRIKIKHTI